MQHAVGELVWRGGVILSSKGSNFGGLSALQSDKNGNLIAVSDFGWRLDATPVFDDNGMLHDLVGIEFGFLIAPDGTALTGKIRADAESLARREDGSLFLSFERAGRHRIVPLDGRKTGEPIKIPKKLKNKPGDEGVEAMTTLPGGQIMILTEDGMTSDREFVIGWRQNARTGKWASITYPVSDDFLPTGATTLANGDLLIVERFYNRRDGVACRIRRIAATDAVESRRISGDIIATFRPPMIVDNFEGITTVSYRGETIILLLSDDNKNRGTQRTLLLAFAFAG